jgi:anti-sigma-K factor RskA
MSIVEDRLPDEGGDDLLAAEFVLGVLSAEERAAAARRIEAEPAFARLVERWEGDLAPMSAAYAPVEPPASVKAGLDRRLFPEGGERSRPRLWSSLAFWRGLAAAAVAALALAILLPFAVRPPAPQDRLVASLSAADSDVRYVALYDPAAGQVDLRHVSGERAAGRDFELWVIEGANQPISMGVIPVGETAQLPVEAEVGGRLAAGAKLAISLEPSGGSPTGLPTGPVISLGDLLRL